MKQKFKEKYHPDCYKHRFLDKLHNLCQGSRSIQDYTTEFDDLTLCFEVQEDFNQAISRYCFELRLDIQRIIFIHSHKLESLKQANQLAQDIESPSHFLQSVRSFLKQQSNLTQTLALLKTLMASL